eukprot:Nk52_evm112s224 gene=Nk52_evmTU112s224
MKFGKTIVEERNEEWGDHYIAYNDLKKRIKVVAEKKARCSLGTDSAEESFLLELDEELRKVVEFFLKKEKELSDKVTTLAHTEQSQTIGRGQRISKNELCKLYEKYGYELVELLKFIELNVTGLRKILKKFDKKTRSAISHRYIAERLAEPQYGLQIYKEGPMKELSSLVRDKLVEYRCDKELTLSIDEAFSRAVEAAQFVTVFAAQAGFERGQYVESRTTSDYPKMSLFLNILSVFLFMTNYYIVVPTTAEYAKRLHTKESFGSLILAVCAVASMVSAVIYSWWTNFAYRTPMIFSSFAILVGNVVYSLADYYGSMYLVLAGRTIIGLGASRGLNRRYINDVVRLQDRTKHCAYFVASSTMGMASGPATAALLSKVEFYWGDFHIDEVTAPGWLMGFVWFVFIIFAYIYFEDPENIKMLKERKEKPEEAEVMIPKSYESGSPDSDGEEEIAGSLSWKMIGPMTICLFFYTALKTSQDGFQASTPIATLVYFGWGPLELGLFLGGLGLSVLPLNLVVGVISAKFSDRQLILATQILTFTGLVLLVNFGEQHEMAMWHYMTGALLYFVSVQVLEGVTMSLISKVIPPALATGFWNAGFLTTEAGTLGRALGDFLVAFAGSGGKSHVQNNTCVPMAIVMFIAIIICITNYNKLVPLVLDDDEAKPLLSKKKSKKGTALV